MSNVLLEAAATGRALITSDVPGCREAVEDGVSGFLCPAMDADALYIKMKAFLDLTPEQRAAMGRAPWSSPAGWAAPECFCPGSTIRPSW